MPDVSTITVNDGTADKDFVPVSRNGISVTFKDTSVTKASLQPHMIAAMDPANSRRRTDHVTVSVALPYVDDTESSYVEHIGRAEVKIILPTAYTSAQRTQLANLVKNAIASAPIQSMITGPEGLF